MIFSEPPEAAWERLSPEDWDGPAAKHLLRRVGWTAVPREVERALAEGLEPTLSRLFPASVPELKQPPLVARFRQDALSVLSKIRSAETVPDKQAAKRELRDLEQAAIHELQLNWLQTAAEPENAGCAKWVLFLSDVFVVSVQQVRNATHLWDYLDTLTVHGLGAAPALAKTLSRSPAMMKYLDLVRSRQRAPNENFARELFELFVLGEGHYTEDDVKQAARAFTGYRIDSATGEFRFVSKQHDDGPKSVFGRTGNFHGDDVIDLAYEQPSAAEFLPREMMRFYLSDEALPAAYVTALGAYWRGTGFGLRALAHRFFGSRLFFAPEFRDNFIKSPVQFYLGLLQDLQLSVTPLPRYALTPLRRMGQQPFQPPNVRGWVGGRSWINSATLAGRRQLVRQVFSPLREEALNADDQMALAEARSAGRERFVVEENQFTSLAEAPAEAAARLTELFLDGTRGRAVRDAVADFLDDEPGNPGRLRDALVAIFQTPEYQLC